MAAAGADHENLGTLSFARLGRDQSMRVRLLPPAFETINSEWYGLLHVEHSWGCYPSDKKTSCPVNTHGPMLEPQKKPLRVCPACQGNVPTVSSLVLHGAVEGRGGVLLRFSSKDWDVLQLMIDEGCLDFEKGIRVELWREGWKLHYDILKSDPVDRKEYEDLMSAADINFKRFEVKKDLLEMMADALDGWETMHRPMPQPNQCQELLKLHPDARFVDIPWFMKAPQRWGWRETPFHLMGGLDYQRALDAGNIGLMCGLHETTAGTWVLIIGLDADDDPTADEFEEANPWLSETFCVHGNRGKKWFFKIEGTRSELETYSHSTTIKRGETEVGDWLADGKQGVILGGHPEGKFYRHNHLPMKTIKPEEFTFLNCQLARNPVHQTRFKGGGRLWDRGRSVASTRTIRSALAFISPDGRDDWFTVGCAIKSWSLEADDAEVGREIFDQWSAQSAKFDDGSQDKLWNSLQRSGNDAVITIGSLFFLAHSKGWRTEEDDDDDDNEN